MIVSLIHILIGIALTAAGVAVGVYFQRRSNSKQPLPAPTEAENKKILDLDDRLHKLEQFRETIEVTLAEQKEFITRSMNRMSARHSKMTKKEEEQEALQALIEQSKMLDNQQEIFEEPAQNGNGHKPRIIRNNPRR